MAAKSLVVLVIVVTACLGARNGAVPMPSTTTVAPKPPPTVTSTRAPAPTAPAPTACTAATDTASPLGRLRTAMRGQPYSTGGGFDAFLVFYSDEHLSEEPAPEERRLEYISGWGGAGTGVVLPDAAAVWVSSVDVARARAALSCAWIVVETDNTSQPTIVDWLTQRVSRRAGAPRVGADTRLVSWAEWQDLAAALQTNGMQLVPTPTLVDQLWDQEPFGKHQRPEPSRIVANIHNKLYTGKSWIDKVMIVRQELRAVEADAMVVTALDEVAWLLNVRGRDLPYAPLLKAFVIVTMSDIRMYTPAGKVPMPVRDEMSTQTCTNCTKGAPITIHDYGYSQIYAHLRGKLSETHQVLIPSGSTFGRGASAAIVTSVPQNKRLIHTSPIIELKARKNVAEINGMHKAHLRDAVAMCTLLHFLGKGKHGQALTELSVAEAVYLTRRSQAGFVGLSMETRVAFGPNGADPEYRASAATSRIVWPNSTLIIQSGGQYDEGTTIVTRTVQFGPTTEEIRRAYTTVVRSLAALSTLQVPGTLPAVHADPPMRAPLWAARQENPHPTGYAVGAALGRREDPVIIDYRYDNNLYPLKEGYFINIEPAWYERNKFGVKLGNVYEIVNKDSGYLGFREATLLPFESKLIDKKRLTEYEINWLNAYNARIRSKLGPELSDLGLTDVLYWMTNNTVQIDLPTKAPLKASKGNTVAAAAAIILSALLALLL